MSASFKKNGIAICSPIEGFDKASIMKNDIVVGENLVSNSYINETSNVYGFANRWVRLLPSTLYTFSVKGNKLFNDHLIVFLYSSDWSWNFHIQISSSIPTIYEKTFYVPKEQAYAISAYSYRAQSTPGDYVHLDWYKLEEGSKATPWTPSPSDGLGDVIVTYTNPIQCNEIYEI